MATDYDEVRPDVAEASEKTLKDVQKIDAPTAKSVNTELDETDVSDGLELPGAIVDEELSVDVVPQGEDEFVCVECFTIRHRSQAEEKTKSGVICRDCVLEYA
ncbi:DUF4193 family protein [Glutamicibacter ardleyensis]|uniref:DUF4193 family protein n=1 Tax=Glutamicibacter ardleyensis TaxID=225894 RepID=UPI003FD5FF88